MVQVYFRAATEFLINIRDLEWKATRGERPFKGVRAAAKTAINHADQADMASVKTMAERILRTTRKRTITEEEYPTKHLEADIANLRSRYEDELAAKYFVYIAPAKKTLIENPLAGWTTTMATFPDAQGDIEEAGKCYALARGTASVFHLMRIMEIGVQVLGTKFGITNVASKLWSNITNEWSTKIKALPETKPAEKAHKEKLSESWVHLDHVRLAWRNPTMHPKQTYTLDEAKDVYDKVRAFMNSLAPLAV